MRSKLKTELRLIIHLLQADPHESEFRALLQNRVDWEYLLQLAEEHRVVPLLFKKLKSEYANLIDPDILGKFQNRYQEIARFNFARSTQLIKLVGALEQEDLPVIAYKGMALAEFAYQDNTLRQFVDIDLLIRKEDFGKVKELFLQLGCQPIWDSTPKQENAILKYYYEYPFFYGKNNTIVEVHWQFLESFFAFDPDLKGVWDRSLNINLYDREIKTLSAEDCIIVLCTHGSKHFWSRLSWICDVAKLIENTTIDWNLTKKLARNSGSLRMLRLGLYLAQELLRTKLPDEMREQISKDPDAVRLGGKITNYICGIETQPTGWTEMAKLHLRMREKLTAKLKYSQRLFTTKLIDKLFMPMGRPQ